MYGTSLYSALYHTEVSLLDFSAYVKSISCKYDSIISEESLLRNFSCISINFCACIFILVNCCLCFSYCVYCAFTYLKDLKIVSIFSILLNISISPNIDCISISVNSCLCEKSSFNLLVSSDLKNSNNLSKLSLFPEKL